MLTQQSLMKHFEYDPLTGFFKRKNRKNAKFPAGTLQPHGYIKIHFEKKQYYAHRLAWIYFYGEFPTKEIDHINGNKSDNRISNLRHVSRSENAQNMKTHLDNSSGLKGVCFFQGKWIAQICINNKKQVIGKFESKEEASNAYKLIAKKIHTNNEYAKEM